MLCNVRLLTRAVCLCEENSRGRCGIIKKSARVGLDIGRTIILEAIYCL